MRISGGRRAMRDGEGMPLTDRKVRVKDGGNT